MLNFIEGKNTQDDFEHPKLLLEKNHNFFLKFLCAEIYKDIAKLDFFLVIGALTFVVHSRIERSISPILL